MPAQCLMVGYSSLRVTALFNPASLFLALASARLGVCKNKLSTDDYP
ncbi:MAG: hypothetical protein ACFFDT_09770 [Candidatus Hodarchaeota archaeon]